ncbi:MAG: TonB-dependent receptor family protein [Betaproteobacteria bacterium]
MRVSVPDMGCGAGLRAGVLGVGLLCSAGGVASQTGESAALPAVMVQSGRLEQKPFEAPASVSVIDEAAVRSAGPGVNLSEALVRAPGVVALNRSNYAQDVQISIRGFGSRAAFGLRGIRLIADGIPATTPDGQGQASTVHLPSTGRIEVLTGPLAQIWGNASGGVIQTFTREPDTQPTLSAETLFGSSGLRRSDLQLSGRSGAAGWVADIGEFSTEGWREHSAATRKQFNGVMGLQLSSDTRLRMVANIFDMPLAKDPLGLTAAQLANPRAAGTNAIAANTRKIVSQEQLGLVLDHRFDKDLRAQARIYSGNRDNLQYQASGTWVSLGRQYDGIGLQLTGFRALGSDHALDWVLGYDFDNSAERRRGGAASAGEKTGTNRDELNRAGNRDIFAQANLHIGALWTITGGVRQSEVRLDSRDDYLTDGDGSGSVRYRATSPVLGLTWHASDELNVYVNQGRGFETPTLAEAAYSVQGAAIVGRFNPLLVAPASRHLEAGIKWVPDRSTWAQAAAFRIDTDNEIVTALSSGGRTAFVNATSTKREGIELMLQRRWGQSWRSILSYTRIDAVYDQAFASGAVAVAAGSRMPAIPSQIIFGSLGWAGKGWAAPGERFREGSEFAIDWYARARLFADDANTAAAPGYGIVNLRARHRVRWGPVMLEAFAGVDNLADRATIGSVIVNQGQKQFYEPGLPRNSLIGLNAKMAL